MRDIRSVMAPLRLPGHGNGWPRAWRIEGEEQAAVRTRLGRAGSV